MEMKLNDSKRKEIYKLDSVLRRDSGVSILLIDNDGLNLFYTIKRHIDKRIVTIDKWTASYC